MNRLGHRIVFLIVGILAPLYLKAEAPFNSLFMTKTCSLEEMNQSLKEKKLDMCWNFGPDSYFRFVTGNDEVYFEVVIGTLPPGYDEFLTRFQDKFIQTETKRTFSYQLKRDGSEVFHLPVNTKQVKPENYSYIVTERRIFENAHPQPLTEAELTDLIKNKNVLFYTGAGLSVCSGIPAMADLQESLGLEASKKFLFSLEKALVHPREFASKILTFHYACLISPPTPAHRALKELATLKKTRILTENLDILHESSGISPYRIDPHQLRQETDETTFHPFDYLICVGLSYDDRGFLGWYKEKNPQGKIIAVDLKQPSYLGDEDFLVTGDIQKILPALQQALVPHTISTPLIEKEVHAKEKEALINLMVQTRLYLIGLREEFQFLREAFAYLLSKNEIERDAGVDDRIFKKMQEVKSGHVEIVSRLDQTIASVTDVEISVRRGAGVASSEILKLTHEKLENNYRKFTLSEVELDKAAAFFNGLNVKEKKTIDEAVLKRGYPLCPAFVKRCERIASQGLAENYRGKGAL